MDRVQNHLSTTETWGGLTPAAFSYLFPALFRDDPSYRAILVCATEEEADRWNRDLEFFSQFAEPDWHDTEVFLLPGWEQSPYRFLQPALSSRLERLRTLERISRKDARRWITITTLASLLELCPAEKFLRETLRLKKGTVISPDELCRRLERLGYTQADSVEDPSTFSQRGGIVDVYPPSLDHPARLDFLDEEVDSIRLFNPETQRSVRLFATGEEVSLPPARAFPCDPDSLLAARERLKEWSDQHDLPKSARERASSLMGQGIVTPEMDHLLPFFQDTPQFLPELLPGSVDLILPEPEKLRVAYDAWREKEEKLFAQSLEQQNLVPGPDDLFLPFDSAVNRPVWRKKIEVRQLAFGEETPRAARIRLSTKKSAADVDGMVKNIRRLQEGGTNSVVVANSQSQLDRILFLLSEAKIRAVNVKERAGLPEDPTVVALALGAISESFHLPEAKLAFFSEDEIFGEKRHGSRPKRRVSAPPVVMEDLVAGDLVVHVEHGIGRYQGLSTIKALKSEGDFALVEYADGAKLYVPVYRLEMLSRYIGAAGASAALDKLGSGSFARTKEKVKASIRDIAQDLLRVQAERATRAGFAFSPPDDEYRRFEAEFPFDETPDQEKSIQETLDDMQSSVPMDRLICGDVGFGKTEVSIRAAFKAVQDGKQVAVLVPTTILAEQHYLTFSSRMHAHPVRIASISRFKSRKEQAAILADLAEGKLDIVIGTHRILSKDVKFKDLGLIIIDEEQRFGVEHKEKLKQMRATTDVLTLTATPIPRTLQMSLMGLKDVSIIRTPPGDRLSIKTHLATFDEILIRDAIRAELGRAGQVFFIHNRVQTIGKMEELIKKLVPEAKVVVAHGQMAEGQLERAMIGFYHKHYDVLVATAIIENGLDVPNANTLIVNRADTFGLSQLYQIRGRVGRSQTRAFAYFLVPDTAIITDEARARLAVLQRFVELGSGYAIATHDLEIRGGGDILGQAQSGQIASVGYEMYVEMLQSEIHRLKGEAVAKPLEEVDINVPFSAVLPQEYVPDMKARLQLYRRLSAVATEEEAEDARKELEDRYGKLPREAEELLCVVRLKILMRRMGLKSLTLGPKGLSLSPGTEPILEPEMILMLVHTRPAEFSILPEGKFIIRGAFRSCGEIYDRLRRLMERSTN
jgi:transcription-repair coupling factor (superfamily II helicase)